MNIKSCIFWSRIKNPQELFKCLFFAICQFFRNMPFIWHASACWKSVCYDHYQVKSLFFRVIFLCHLSLLFGLAYNNHFFLFAIVLKRYIIRSIIACQLLSLLRFLYREIVLYWKCNIYIKNFLFWKASVTSWWTALLKTQWELKEVWFIFKRKNEVNMMVDQICTYAFWTQFNS